MSLKKIREKYPQYNDMSDLELAEGFYKKHYSDISESDYFEKISDDNPLNFPENRLSPRTP